MPRHHAETNKQPRHLPQGGSAADAAQTVRPAILALRKYCPLHADLSNVFRDVRKNRDLNNTADSVYNISAIQPAHSRKSTTQQEQLRIVRNKGSAEDGVSESELIRQLSFVFNNASSSDIVESGDGYQVRAGLNVSDTVRQMISEMADLGWLHRKILGEGERAGTIRKALRLGVQLELNEYYRWVGVLENQAKEGQLTLRKLERWSFNPAMKLKWLAIVLEAVTPFDGCHIISIVNSYRPNGLQTIQQLLNRLLSHLLQPLLHYVHNWVYMGELLDSSGEFFILENRKVSESEEWNDRFRLIAENIPNILSRETARMIFITGKTIYFLRNRCKIIYNVKIPFLDTKGLIGEGQGLNLPALTAWLTAVHEEVNQALVDVLLTQFNLKAHLQSMKNFFLLGKGDFIQNLYDSLKDKLSSKKHELSEHSLDGYISDAISKCFGERAGQAERLLAKKVDYGSGSEGWDCFNLQYSLERIEPVVTLLSPESMMNYQKIFYFLWRIKQIEENLKNVWVLQAKDEAARLRAARSEEIRAIFHFAYLLRHTMMHFLTNLHSYLMIIMEASWKKFWEELEKATSFDQILTLHQKFQRDILEITLNTASSKQISQALNNLFSVIANFKTVSLKLQENFEDYYQKLRLYQERQLMAQKGYIHEESLELPEFNSGKLFKDMRDLKLCYDQSFKNFYTQIRKEGENKLSVLSFKLDFSEYYTNKYVE